VEYGLSAAGDALEWLGRITGRPTAELLDLATQSPPGAAGVLAVPWFNGARAPWWQPGAQAAFLHLATGHGAGDLARALFEGVAWEVARSIEALGGADRVIAAGGGALSTFWPELVAAVTGVSVRQCRSPELASVGACLIASASMGLSYERDQVNPDIDLLDPPHDLVKRYRQLRPRSDQATKAVLGLLK
jgi:sugar (pentulose or hexulose) kinase